MRAVRLKVTHNLLAKHGVKLEDVREVLSHGQALSQCANFLAGLKNVKATVVENTAVAARTVAQSERNDLAALSSRFCAEEYSLNVLKANVQDQDNNYTRFICISKNLEVYPGADRTSLMMTLPHKPGSLYNVLSKFYALGINLRKLESRPLPDREFEFMFYFDLECSVYAARDGEAVPRPRVRERASALPRHLQRGNLLMAEAGYGLIGKSSGHSFSPYIHGELGGYDYSLIELERGELGRFLKRGAFRGLNVTVPYKKDVIPYCAWLSPEARRIGSVNTIVNDGGPAARLQHGLLRLRLYAAKSGHRRGKTRKRSSSAAAGPRLRFRLRCTTSAQKA